MASTAEFPRSDRLLRSSDFKLLTKQGKRVAGRYFVLFWKVRQPSGELESSRIGITVSRKVGNAVIRNRLKRRVREWFRTERGALNRDVDLVVIARPASVELGTRETWETLRKMVRKNSIGVTTASMASSKELG